MIRFLHASDLHLGKPFGTFPEDVRGRLRQARLNSISKLAEAARAGGASHVLLAGDTFDAETPAPQTLRHAMNAMSAAEDLTWVLMPGNHDHLGASEIWPVLSLSGPANVQLALAPQTMVLGASAMLLPAPCTTRNPGRDLTEWMDTAETGEAIRVGLAHGSIRDFRAVDEMGGEGGAVIAPDRAARARLDYLGFGDWHGRIEVSPSTWYSGAPEADSFKPHRPAGALLVEIAGPGAAPKVAEVETGQISWMRLTIDLLEGEEATERLAAALPQVLTRERTLVDLGARGRTTLAMHAALNAGAEQAAPDFLWFDHDLAALTVSHAPDDLSAIDAHGAVRDAAEGLAEAADSGDPVAAAALARLYSYAVEVEAE